MVLVLFYYPRARGPAGISRPAINTKPHLRADFPFFHYVAPQHETGVMAGEVCRLTKELSLGINLHFVPPSGTFLHPKIY